MRADGRDHHTAGARLVGRCQRRATARVRGNGPGARRKRGESLAQVRDHLACGGARPPRPPATSPARRARSLPVRRRSPAARRTTRRAARSRRFHPADRRGRMGRRGRCRPASRPPSRTPAPVSARPRRLAPSARSVRSCRSPYTISVVSATVASTPPMPVGCTVSSGTGLYANLKCVSSRKPLRARSSSRLSLDVAGLAAERRLDHRPDHVPDLRPAFGGRLAHRVRVLRARDRLVRVVVDLHELRAPPQEHREPIAQQETDGRAQRVGPAGHGAQRRLRPVDGAHERPHVATVGQHVGTHVFRQHLGLLRTRSRPAVRISLARGRKL